MTSQGFDPISLTLLLTGLALLPLLLMICTSFLKIAVVLIIARNAMGVQQAPPTMALYAIALAMSALIMAPVVKEVVQEAKGIQLEQGEAGMLMESVGRAVTPVRDFMARHAHPEATALFLETAKKLWPARAASEVRGDDFLVLLPSFVVSELKAGFEMGFLIYIPFIVIDLIVSNLLLALGMQMVAPMMVSLPLKILLFVMVDGWTKLLNGIALSYV